MHIFFSQKAILSDYLRLLLSLSLYTTFNVKKKCCKDRILTVVLGIKVSDKKQRESDISVLCQYHWEKDKEPRVIIILSQIIDLER